MNLLLLSRMSDINFEEISQKILGSTRKIVMSSQKLPNPGTEYSLNLSVPAVRKDLSEKREDILSVIDQMLSFLNVKVPLSTIMDSSKWQDDADVEDFLDVLIDANDQIFEHIGESLDTAAGLKKDAPEIVIVNAPRHRFRKPAANSEPSSKGENSNGANEGHTKSTDVMRLIAARIVERPQIKFPDKIDNGSSIFVPKLTHKPNALRPLDESMIRLDDGDGSYQNPYAFELQSFVVSDEFVVPSEYGAPKSLEETPLVMVETPSQLDTMLKDLSIVSEIAVDLEHHSYRTFQGFTCLMQISSRLKDYVIDTIALRGYMNQLLPIFTNPNVVKIFHGAEMDVQWLQRDCGLYVVNMFDSYKAAKTLGFPKLSLAYLLERYLQIDVDKRFQLADWRIRPLPEELIKYARSDTHYLLHVCDLLKRDLIERAKYEGNDDHHCLVRRVFDESTSVCSLHYEKPIFTEDSHLELYERSRKVFNSQQLMALKLLYAWRDKIARREDESTGYVLPNHMLLQMAELLPKEPTGVLACCQPIPPLVKQQVHEMHGLILQARRQPLQQVENPAVAAAKAHFVSTQKISPELQALSCPLDVNAKLPEFNPQAFSVQIVPSSPQRKRGQLKSSSFIDMLRSFSSSQKSSAKDALIHRALDMFKGYAFSCQDLPQSDKKPGLVVPEVTQSLADNENSHQKRTPVKRSASAAEAPNLHLQPIAGANSASPAKKPRRAKKKEADPETPLVPPTMTRRRRKRGSKFVEDVVVVSDNEGDEPEEGEIKKKSPRGKGNKQDKHAKRRDMHERSSRQMQTFSGTRKSPRK